MKLFVDSVIVSVHKYEEANEGMKELSLANRDQVKLFMYQILKELSQPKESLLLCPFYLLVDHYVVSILSYLNGNILTFIRDKGISERAIDEMITEAIEEIAKFFEIKESYLKSLYEDTMKEETGLSTMRPKQCADCGKIYSTRGHDRICKSCYHKRTVVGTSDIKENVLEKYCPPNGIYLTDLWAICDLVYESDDVGPKIKEAEKMISSLEEIIKGLRRDYRFANNKLLIFMDQRFYGVPLILFHIREILVPEVIPAVKDRIATCMISLKELVDEAFEQNISAISDSFIQKYVEIINLFVQQAMIFDDLSKIEVAGAIAAAIRINRIPDAVKMVAAFDVDVSVDETRKVSKKWLNKDETLEELLIDKMIWDINNFEEYYRIIEEYPNSLQLLKLLMFTARWTRRYSNILNIYQCLEKMDTHNNCFLEQKIISNRLKCLNDISDMYEVKKITKELEQAYDGYKNESHKLEEVSLYYNNLLEAYFSTGNHKTIISVSKGLNAGIYNEKTFYYLSKAYFYLGKTEEAERYCLAAIRYMDNVVASYFLLGQIYMKWEKYDEAISALNKTINLINYYYDKRKYVLTAENGHVNVYWSIDGKEKELEQVYMYLLQAYMGAEDYTKARAVYDCFIEEVKVADSTITSGMMLTINQKIEGKKEQIKAEYKALQKVHKAKSQKLSEVSSLLNDLSKQLLSIQIVEESEEKISDEYWEQNVKEKMYRAIEELKKSAHAVSEKRYQEIRKELEETFPYLISEAMDYLTSAVQMYELFEENNLVDYAPVMVELGKVVEAALWNYLRQAKAYQHEVRKNKEKGFEETLGSAVYIIGRKSVSKEYLGRKHFEMLEKIKEYRNASAHVNISRKPKVEEVKNYLIETSDLLQFISEKENL